MALIKQCKKCIADAESRLAKVKSDDEADNEAEKQEREEDAAPTIETRDHKKK